jgi:restriction endonuclease Mrr
LCRRFFSCRAAGFSGVRVPTSTGAQFVAADFKNEATRDSAPAIDLIDGGQLCELLKSLKLGVTTKMVEEVTVVPEWFAGI